jgi:hypothetical protein
VKLLNLFQNILHWQIIERKRERERAYKREGKLAHRRLAST